MNTAERIIKLAEKIAHSPNLKAKTSKKNINRSNTRTTIRSKSNNNKHSIKNARSIHDTSSTRSKNKKNARQPKPTRKHQLPNTFSTEANRKRKNYYSLRQNRLEKIRHNAKSLMTGIEYKNRLISISWIVKEGKGNTSFEKWLEVIEPLIRSLKSNGVPLRKIYLVTDREFGSLHLAKAIMQLALISF